MTSLLSQLQNHIAFLPLSLRALLFSIADVKKHTNPFNSTSKPSLPSQKKKQTKQKLKKNEGEVKINISRKLKHRRGYAKEKIPVWQI